jgi:hypothetical protein
MGQNWDDSNTVEWDDSDQTADLTCVLCAQPIAPKQAAQTDCGVFCPACLRRHVNGPPGCTTCRAEWGG